MTAHTREPSSRQLRLPLFLLGVGLGGFIDGIVLHQILQWHHMLSDVRRYPPDTVAGIEANTLADGLFHAVAWLVVATAVVMLARRRHAAPPTRGTIVGWMLTGWGAFNLVEGAVDHHLLRVHHVRDDVADPLPWDLAFLAVSLLLLAVGLITTRRAAGVPHIQRRR